MTLPDTCPNCKADMRGGEIPGDQRHLFGGERHWMAWCVQSVDDRGADAYCPYCGHRLGKDGAK